METTKAAILRSPVPEPSDLGKALFTDIIKGVPGVDPAIAAEMARRSAGDLVRDITQAQRAVLRKLTEQAFLANWSEAVLADHIATRIGLDTRGVNAVENFRKGMLAQGLPAGIARKRANDYAKRLRTYRAQVIAQTELARLTADAKRRMWQQWRKEGKINQYAVRVWHTHKDERMCPVCRPMNGQRAAIGRNYSRGMSGPPVHPNCRCWETLNLGADVVGKETVEKMTVIEAPSTVVDVNALWEEYKHPRDRHGKFRHKLGIAAKLKGIIDRVQVRSGTNDRQENVVHAIDRARQFGAVDLHFEQHRQMTINAIDEGIKFVTGVRDKWFNSNMSQEEMWNACTDKLEAARNTGLHISSEDFEMSRDLALVGAALVAMGGYNRDFEAFIDKLRLARRNAEKASSFGELHMGDFIRSFLKWNGARVAGQRMLDTVRHDPDAYSALWTEITGDPFPGINNYKDQLAKTLPEFDNSFITGDPFYDFAASIQKLWAGTSSDSNPGAWATQYAIAHMMEQTNPDSHDTDWTVAGSSLENDPVSKGKDRYMAMKRVYDLYTISEYNLTQEALADVGLDTITVVRGMETVNPVLIEAGVEKPALVQGRFNPASSWSAVARVARNFGRNGVFVGVFPRQFVVGLAQLGFGCFNESEVIASVPDGEIWWVSDNVADTKTIGDRLWRSRLKWHDKLAMKLDGLTRENASYNDQLVNETVGGAEMWPETGGPFTDNYFAAFAPLHPDRVIVTKEEIAGIERIRRHAQLANMAVAEGALIVEEILPDDRFGYWGLSLSETMFPDGVNEEWEQRINPSGFPNLDRRNQRQLLRSLFVRQQLTGKILTDHDSPLVRELAFRTLRNSLFSPTGLESIAMSAQVVKEMNDLPGMPMDASLSIANELGFDSLETAEPGGQQSMPLSGSDIMQAIFAAKRREGSVLMTADEVETLAWLWESAKADGDTVERLHRIDAFTLWVNALKHAVTYTPSAYDSQGEVAGLFMYDNSYVPVIDSAKEMTTKTIDEFRLSILALVKKLRSEGKSGDYIHAALVKLLGDYAEMIDGGYRQASADMGEVLRGLSDKLNWALDNENLHIDVKPQAVLISVGEKIDGYVILTVNSPTGPTAVASHQPEYFKDPFVGQIVTIKSADLAFVTEGRAVGYNWTWNGFEWLFKGLEAGGLG